MFNLISERELNVSRKTRRKKPSQFPIQPISYAHKIDQTSEFILKKKTKQFQQQQNKVKFLIFILLQRTAILVFIHLLLNKIIVKIMDKSNQDRHKLLFVHKK